MTEENNPQNSQSPLGNENRLSPMTEQNHNRQSPKDKINWAAGCGLSILFFVGLNFTIAILGFLWMGTGKNTVELKLICFVLIYAGQVWYAVRLSNAPSKSKFKSGVLIGLLFSLLASGLCYSAAILIK